MLPIPTLPQTTPKESNQSSSCHASLCRAMVRAFPFFLVATGGAGIVIYNLVVAPIGSQTRTLVRRPGP